MRIGPPRRGGPTLNLMENAMRLANTITLVLVIIGGLNWGLVGVLNWDLVAAIFGTGSAVSRTVYVLVALSALWQLIPLFAALRRDDALALRGHSAH
jgi:uncharacterized membrane protein YuzA (DUF378 family)